jgi:TatD DNase family protein
VEKPELFHLMIFTDSHTHLYAAEFDVDRDHAVRRAIDAGVTRMFLPNIDIASIQPMLDLVWSFPDHCFPMIGLHPCSVDAGFEAQLTMVRKWMSKRKFYAMGEIGLDHYWSKEFVVQQEEAFRTQVEWAVEADLPIVIHSRETTGEIIRILREMGTGFRGVFHCFSGNAGEAEEILGLGMYLGIGGVLTFKRSELAAAINDVPLERMLLETDSPYLAPVPYRGKRNESSYVPLIAARLAELKNTTVEKVAEITTQNSRDLFGI